MKIDALPEEPGKQDKGASYDVGYAKPPKAGRFTKGKSGNPKGRPKGSKNKPRHVAADRLKGIILEEAYREVDLREGDKIVTVPVAQAVLRTMAVKAATGNQRAAQLFTDLLGTTEREAVVLRTELFEIAIEYRNNAWQEIRHREARGVSIDDILPHPDHVHINPRTGSVRFVGPMTSDEKALWDDAYTAREETLEFRDTLVAKLETVEEEGRRASLISVLGRVDRALAQYDAYLPDRKPHALRRL